MTAAEVARAAGVSRSAVSRTFTPGASVSSRVRARVIEAADGLGYRVNRLARGLISARSNLVGIVGTTIEMPFHASLLEALSDALQADGFDCMLLNAAHADRDLAAVIERVLEYRVAAIVVMSGLPPAWIVEQAIDSGVPVILINKRMPRLPVDTVITDHARGGREAARRLIAAGRRRLALVSSGDRTLSLIERLKAFGSEAAAAAVPVSVWEQGPTSYETGWQAGRALLGDERIDGAFCVTDILALGFLDAARRELGRRVPDELSVIGFDDIPQAAWGAYRLTTFRQEVQGLARGAIESLRRRLGQRDAPPAKLVLPAGLITRETLAASEGAPSRAGQRVAAS